MNVTEKISKGQIRKIKVTQRAIGMADYDYYLLLVQRFGARSCTELTRRQARQLIDLLTGKTCIACSPRPPRERLPVNVTVLASQEQLHRIEDLRQAHSWAWHPRKYAAWLNHKFSAKWAAQGWPADRVVLSPQATDVIEALKVMVRQEKRCACAWNQEAAK